MDFNPRSPRGGATLSTYIYIYTIRFQSTLPTRGSDARLRMARGRIEAISIHAPHEGERQARIALRMPAGDISIHAPHEGERPPPRKSVGAAYMHFNPRSPRGGATRHADQQRKTALYFNPRSPRGGATVASAPVAAEEPISIHAPHEGERLNEGELAKIGKDFNPRSPRGGATMF